MTSSSINLDQNSDFENRSSILEKSLFDHLFNNPYYKYQKEKLTLVDESHFKKLNTILSNLPLELIQRIYENVCSNEVSNSFIKHAPKIKKNSKSSSVTKNDLLTKRKQLLNQNETIRLKSSRLKKNDSLDSRDLTSSLTKISTNKHLASSPNRRPSSAQGNLSKSQSYYSSITNQIVIHVCDEAKRLKQDFTCPRELLISEMKYFSYNLNINVTNSSHNQSGAHAHSSLSQTALSKKTLDEIDISVHCDIKIFDWLMRYVKRSHPYLNENNIASSQNTCLNENLNFIIYNSDHTPKYIEPKLEFNNCVSILLSSDFLLMGDLVDKCVLFISKNLESVLQVPCVMSGISEPLLIKLASCVDTIKLDEVFDRKDKLKTKLFQRKLELMFDLEKYKSVFENSTILNDWKSNRYEYDLVRSHENQNEKLTQDNYLNFLYECENDASSLFKCKLCSRLMTKQQSLNLNCQLAILSKHGDYIYLHVPDEKLDLTHVLQLLKEKLKTWQNVYWFVWALIKSFKCKKCNEWFRLVEIDKCRLNNNTYCEVHDSKIFSNTNQNSCSCIHSEHVFDTQSASIIYAKSQIITEVSPFESPEVRINKFVQHIIETFEKKRNLVCNGIEAYEDGSSYNICGMIEDILKNDAFGKDLSSAVNSKNLRSLPISNDLAENYLVDSISGKHIILINKHLFNLFRLTQSNLNETSLNITQLDLKSYLKFISKIEPTNIFNSLDVFNWLKVENRMKWDISKPTRLNQDNQREDDMKRFREITSYLIKAKLMEESVKQVGLKSPIAIVMANNNNNSNVNNLNNFVGGIYCRVESEWKQRSFN